MDNFATLVQALPQELYNEVLDRTFTPPRGIRVINENYTSPVKLQVNRATRARFAELYCGNSSIFAFKYSSLIHHLLRSTPQEHLKHIVAIRLPTTEVEDRQDVWVGSEIEVAKSALSSWHDFGSRIVRNSMNILDVFKFGIHLPDGDVRWVSYYQLEEGSYTF